MCACSSHLISFSPVYHPVFPLKISLCLSFTNKSRVVLSLLKNTYLSESLPSAVTNQLPTLSFLSSLIASQTALNVLFIAHKPVSEVLSQILPSPASTLSHSSQTTVSKFFNDGRTKGKEGKGPVGIPCNFKYLFYVLMFWELIKNPLN